MVDLEARHDPDGAMGVFILMAADPPLTGLHCPLIGDLCWDAVIVQLNFSLRFLQKLLGGCTFYKILSSSFFSPAVQSRRENKVKCFSYKKTS